MIRESVGVGIVIKDRGNVMIIGGSCSWDLERECLCESLLLFFPQKEKQ